MRTIIGIALCTLAVGCGQPSNAPPPPTPTGMLRIKDAHLVLATPAGWSEMGKEMWQSRGFAGGFQKGNEPQVPVVVLPDSSKAAEEGV